MWYQYKIALASSKNLRASFWSEIVKAAAAGLNIVTRYGQVSSGQSGLDISGSLINHIRHIDASIAALHAVYTQL